jgi:hypothetical protein
MGRFYYHNFRRVSPIFCEKNGLVGVFGVEVKKNAVRQIFSDNAFKTASIASSVIGAFVTVPLLYGIIWSPVYESFFRTKQFRTNFSWGKCYCYCETAGLTFN